MTGSTTRRAHDVRVIAARLAAQGLSGAPAGSAGEVVQRLLAVQAQDPRGARLAIRSRSAGLLAADVDAALNDRSLVVSWLNRGTLHLVAPDDYWWLHPLTTPQLAVANRRRLQQEGVSAKQAEHGIDIVTEAVLENGPQTRIELRDRLDAAGVPTARQALIHVLFAATLRGNLIRGPMRRTEQAFVAPTKWLGTAPPPLERAEALARLARRYLAGHGPADARDLAKWAGITLGDARTAIAEIRAEVEAGPGDLVALAARDSTEPLPSPRLLGPFDPLLLGWVSRESFVGAHKHIATTNGIIRAVALVDGRVVATWGVNGNTLTMKPLEQVKRATLEALRTDAVDVARFLALSERYEIVIEL